MRMSSLSFSSLTLCFSLLNTSCLCPHVSLSTPTALLLPAFIFAWVSTVASHCLLSGPLKGIDIAFKRWLIRSFPDMEEFSGSPHSDYKVQISSYLLMICPQLTCAACCHTTLSDTGYNLAFSSEVLGALFPLISALALPSS